MRRLAATALALAFFVPVVSSQDRPASTRVTFFSEDAAQTKVYATSNAQTKIYATSDLAKQARAALTQTSGRIELAGLSKPVEVLRDSWGVAHIYAQTQEDLFFAQGFVAAQDRLWQMEIWRRTGEGKLAEILGPSVIERDKFARLMRYRGDMEAEWKSYAPDAQLIIQSFVRGVNAFIDASRD